VSLLWANAESIQIRNASDGELVREITTPGYNFVRVGNSVWSSIWSGTAGQIRIYNIGVRSGVRTFLASCKFANSAPCAQQTMKVKTEFSIATRISSLVAVGEQVWGACQDLPRSQDTHLECQGTLALTPQLIVRVPFRDVDGTLVAAR